MKTNAVTLEKVTKRVQDLRSFYNHAIIYGIFVLFFLYLNLSSGGFPWAIFPIVGWGIGLLSHASSTYQINIIFGKTWEANKIKKLMDRDLIN